ncbi:MAG: hypothetical protein DCC58_11745 [Chloroflexi bacterium]|nr:MAG: hypothetical protein DCC58_11745 [Chloroflexota bacterium]
MGEKGNQAVVQLGSARAERGQRAEGWWEIGRRTNNTPIQAPVIIVNGANPGPALWIQNAIHGDEYDGAVGIWRMLEQVNPATLNGALICLPVLNASAFEARSRVSPIDFLDVNRVFPGDPTTTYTPRLARLVLETIPQLADVMIDLHGGGNEFRVAWYTIFHDEDNEAGRLSRELSLAAGPKYVWASRQPWLENALFTRLTRQGIAAMLVECGGEGRLLEENTHAHAVSLLNMLRHLRMIDGAVDDFGKPERVLLNNLDFFHCTQGGFITSYVQVGEEVSLGQPLMLIRDEFGREVETIVSTADNAVVIGLHTMGITTGGAQVGQLALKA